MDMHLLLPFIETEITDQYVMADNNRPWVLGFSGGKDSTLLLQLVWKVIAALPEAQRHRPVFVTCNDTLVENPHMAGFIENTLQRIEQAAKTAQLPILVERTRPALADTFWVNLIGKGYPAPSSTFRWCTDRLKISPTTAFIKRKISQAGEVIILLGTREAESATRARSMQKHAVLGQRLRRHVLPNAAVFAPIRDVQTADLWQYLSQCPPPWGGSHKQLITLYRNASTDADCPMVVDISTPSCGKSRFGCWVCTVVARDKSMEGLISNGQEWMEPLAELRDFLITARDEPETYRQKELRRGYVREEAWGPYLPGVRADILRRLLSAQRLIQQTQDPLLSFVNHQELVAIQAQWHRDGLFGESVAGIYNSVYPEGGMAESIGGGRRAAKEYADAQLLRQVCAEQPGHADLIEQVMAAMNSQQLLPKSAGARRRRGPGPAEVVLDAYLKGTATQ